ncbi:MAG: hypothetical protein KA099_08210 [Alphaproteobacteria bacterium]|nr:hypothetical protein [Alphaproteobacteria bacterium]MBP7757815.1 hypothetical protein [Alphaproteobacteria bacterium]MBP7760985.1 hypothetical protein [Alphaproteobacteria bacterium]MBP7905291.1 hypothetical protein [Alphaproteobacteria bacterium]
MFKITVTKVICFFSFLFIAGFPNSSFSDGGDALARFKKPMPNIDLLPEKDFLESTKEHKVIPYGDKTLAYTIRWPKDWDQAEDKGSSNFELNTKLFTSINIWYSPPRMGGRSRLEVKAVDLENQLSAEQWYLKNLLQTGQTLEGFIVHSEKKVEALMIVMEEDVSYYLRTVTIINGKRVLQAQYYVPMFFWNEEKVMQAQCLSTFDISYPTEETIEKLEKFQFLDVAEVMYPETWRSHAKPLKSIENMNVKFLNVRKTKNKMERLDESIEGQIDVTLVSSLTSESLLTELENYKKNMEGTGMIVGKKIETIENFKYNENYSFAASEAYEGIDSSNDSMDYELWFSLLVSGNYYYFVSLLTPSRNESYNVWALNTQTYKIIINNIRPSAAGFIDKADDL